MQYTLYMQIMCTLLKKQAESIKREKLLDL